MSTYYLMHHGVEGQEWGKRNGPPYPLNAEGRKKLDKQIKKTEKKVDKAPGKTVRRSIGAAAAGVASAKIAAASESTINIIGASAAAGEKAASLYASLHGGTLVAYMEGAMYGAEVGANVASFLGEYGAISAAGLATGGLALAVGAGAAFIGGKIAKKKLSELKEERQKDDAEKQKRLDHVLEVEDSKEYKDDMQKAYTKAYNNTVKWFKENDPEYLKSIESKDGKSTDYSNYHDFEKTLEGYTDEEYQKVDKKYGIDY